MRDLIRVVINHCG